MTEQENLELQIRTYDSNYRAGTPICTDEAYDKLVDELREKFPKSNLLKKGIIKQNIKESRKERLPLQMASLNKCKSLKEIEQWLISNRVSKNEPLIITPKYDGISLVTEESNDLAWTSGDGEIGQRSHVHFSKMNDKHCGTDLFSFGEAIMPKNKFFKYKDKFANPRNMVAGLFNRDEAGDELRDVDYIRYGSNRNDLSKLNQLNMLNRINEISVRFYVSNLDDLSEELLTELFKEWGIDYQIDGLVIDINSEILRNKLGREENLNPKYARAIKLPEWFQTAEVRVSGVTWQVSKQGKLKPVIQIEPTELAGVMIENVTGYNAKYIFDNSIAKDSIIRIVRSGDVIPKHLKTLNYNSNLVQDLSDDIATCPCCEHPTVWDVTFTELVCTNINCKERQIMKLVHFFSVLEIEDFGEPSIRKLYNSGFKSIESILNIILRDILSIEGFGQVSIKKLFDQFDKLKYEGVPFAKLLHALDYCDGKIGEKTIQLILDNLESIEDLKQIFSKSFFEKLISINGVSGITANVFIKAVDQFFTNEVQSTFPVLISYFQTPKQEVVGDKFNGMKLCFTGCRPTKEQEQEIQSQGGEIVNGVSKNTTHLVVKDVSSSSSKTQKAKELGVKIIQINELWK